MTQSMDPAYYTSLPAGLPPENVLPNFDYPETRAPTAHVAMGISLAVATVFLMLRLYTKFFIMKLWGWDDCEYISLLV